MRGRGNHAVRATALALAAAVNALFLSLWLISRVDPVRESVVQAMIWISASQPPLPPPPPVPNEPRVPSAVRFPLPALITPTPEQSTAITVPPIDWYAEGLRSARNAFPDEVREKPAPSLDSKPQALVLPDKSRQPHKFGDVEHYEGGEIITWINETCFISNKPSEGGFGGLSDRSIAPRLKVPTCKARSMARRRGEAAAKALEELKPGYLRRSLPVPDLPEADLSRD